MALNTSDCVKVNRIYAKSMKQVLIRWNYLFLWSRQNELPTRTSAYIINWSNVILRSTLKVLDNFKNKRKSVRNNAFWYVNVCIFWKCIQYTIHWDITQMLIKFPSDKINGTKNVLFFLLRAPTYHRFSFSLQFLDELRHKVCLSKIVCGVFHFWFCFVFIKVYIFVQQNAWTLWL